MNTWLFKSVTDSITRLARGSKADGASLKAALETLTRNIKLFIDKIRHSELI